MDRVEQWLDMNELTLTSFYEKAHYRKTPLIYIDSGNVRLLNKSSFHLTLNSQKNFRSKKEDLTPVAYMRAEQQIGNKLKEAIRRTFNESEIAEVIKLVPVDGDGPQFSMGPLKVKIRSLQSDIGPKNKRVHAHANIEILHYSKIRIDLDALRNKFRYLLMDPRASATFDYRINGINVQISMNKNDEFERWKYSFKPFWQPLVQSPSDNFKKKELISQLEKISQIF